MNAALAQSGRLLSASSAEAEEFTTMPRASSGPPASKLSRTRCASPPVQGDAARRGGIQRRRLRCKIRSYLTPKFAANFTDFRQLVRARSRLYRSRFLQPNTHFAAFFEIYKNIIPSHRSKFKKFANFRREVFAIFKISCKNLLFFTVFVDFCTDFDENFSEFR